MRLISFLLLSLLALTSLHAQNKDEQLIRLGNHLERIRQEYEFSRLLSGFSLTGTGALVGATGTAVAYAVGGDVSLPNGSNLRSFVLIVSWAYAGAFIIPGGLILALKPDYETMPERFAKTPGQTEAERTGKILQGELSLQSLADKAGFERGLTAGLLGLAGGYAIYASLENGGSYSSSSAVSSSGPKVNSGMATGLFYLGAAVLRAVFLSTPESENQSYLKWKSSAK